MQPSSGVPVCRPAVCVPAFLCCAPRPLCAAQDGLAPSGAASVSLVVVATTLTGLPQTALRCHLLTVPRRVCWEEPLHLPAALWWFSASASASLLPWPLQQSPQVAAGPHCGAPLSSAGRSELCLELSRCPHLGFSLSCDTVVASSFDCSVDPAQLFLVSFRSSSGTRAFSFISSSC